jgi:hypothetical protein
MEFRVAMVAFAGVLLLGILKGVLLARDPCRYCCSFAASRIRMSLRWGGCRARAGNPDRARNPENEAVPAC